MIVVSGRCLSRAWTAVALAAADDEARPLLSGIHVEEYVEGVRLVATDSYWLAQCWVPAYDFLQGDGGMAWTDLGAGEAGQDTPEVDLLDGHGLVDAEATVLDADGRVKDMMTYLRKATGHKQSIDLPVVIDLAAQLDEDPLEPTLFPELTQAAVRFELSTRDRVLAQTVDGHYPEWRGLLEAAKVAGPDLDAVTALSEWMLDRLGKAARATSAGSIELDWRDRGGRAGAARALWRVRGSRLHHAPSGMLAGLTNPGDDALDDDALAADAAEGLIEALEPFESVTISSGDKSVTLAHPAGGSDG